MTLPGWCEKFKGTQTVGKGILIVFLLVVFTLVVYPQVAAKQVMLVVDGHEEAIVTHAKTVSQVLEENGLFVRSNDILMPKEETKLERGMEIHLQRAVPVFLQVDGQTRLVYSIAANAAELLGELGIAVAEDDRVEPGLTAMIDHGAKINITRVNRELIEEEEPIPFKTEQKNDPNLDLGRRKVMTEGKTGTLLRVYEVVYADGSEEARNLIEEKRVAEPINSVVHIGTKEAPPILTASARDGRVSSAIEGMASWYGAKFHGNKTAYGDIYDMNKMTAAFPDRSMYGKKLRVTYLKTGRSVDVLVNDYGPHVSGRIIDLSMAAARSIGLMADGVGKVKVEVLK
jgi:uncharacterized protein YabE (DUF348 family)